VFKLIVFLNGEFLEDKAAKISPFDQGFLLGVGLFETMRAYQGKVFALERHLARLRKSAAEMGIDLPQIDLEKVIDKLLEVNQLPDAYVRVTLTRGEGESFRQKPSSPTLFAFARSFQGYSEEVYKEGVEAIFAEFRKGQSPLLAHKTTSFAENVLARLVAEKEGFFEAIFLSTSGEILEGSMSNLFLVKNDKLLTPPLQNILPGITREVILEIAEKKGIKTEEVALTEGDLCEANEVFLTNSLIEVVPVVKVEGETIGKGKPGKLTWQIHQLYREQIFSELDLNGQVV
jgi:branched-chain amino acid aminotransferase